jgi:hypothetical protein
MRIVRIEAAERPVEMPEADEVLLSRRYVFDTGNFCVVTPGVKYLGGGECRILINYAWLQVPTEADERAIQDYMTNMVGMGEPEFLSTSPDRAASERVCNGWLGAGQVPPGPD